MEEIKVALEDLCVIDQHPRLEGRNMVMIVAPKK
jgi:translation initiation factor IF-3